MKVKKKYIFANAFLIQLGCNRVIPHRICLRTNHDERSKCSKKWHAYLRMSLFCCTFAPESEKRQPFWILLNLPPSLLPPILVRQKMGLTWDLLGTHLGLTRLCVRTESWAWLTTWITLQGYCFFGTWQIVVHRHLSRPCPGCQEWGIAIASNLTVLTVYSYRISTPTSPHPKF